MGSLGSACKWVDKLEGPSGPSQVGKSGHPPPQNLEIQHSRRCIFLHNFLGQNWVFSLHYYCILFFNEFRQREHEFLLIANLFFKSHSHSLLHDKNVYDETEDLFKSRNGKKYITFFSVTNLLTH